MEEESFIEPFYRKPLLLIVSLFLLFLVLSLTFIDSIQGIVQSKTVQENTLIFSNTTIIFANNTLQLLQREYLSNSEREIKACLFGTINNSLYNIARIEFPRVVRANVIHIVAVQCPDAAIIDLHSHPINSCLASEQDISTYKQLQTTNRDLKMLIMCSRARFAIV